MPFYQCISPEGLLGESARGKLAEEITRIHCDATGVPPSFVIIMFTDVPSRDPARKSSGLRENRAKLTELGIL